MAANGLAKLIKECGELIQVAGKKLVIEIHGLNTEYIDSRILSKLERFRDWHANPNNNVHGVDAPKDLS